MKQRVGCLGLKKKTKTMLDLFMTALMPLLMSYSLVGEAVHEWLGIAMTVLFVLHHTLNFGWYRSLFRGRYTAFRLVLTIVNSLLFADFLLLFYSGIDLSKHLLPLLPGLGSASLSRILHLSGSHWGLLLMSFHLGLHMGRFTVLLKKRRSLSVVLTILGCFTALYGCDSFAAMDFAAYLLPTTSFLFFDASQPLVRLFPMLVSIMVLFVLLGTITTRLTQLKSKKERQ